MGEATDLRIAAGVTEQVLERGLWERGRKLWPRIYCRDLISTFGGFESQKALIDAQIAELRAMLTGPNPGTEPASPPSPNKRSKITAASRKRMAEAQKQRGARIKGEGAIAQAAPAEPKVKRKMSSAGKKNIIDALRRRKAPECPSFGLFSGVLRTSGAAQHKPRTPGQVVVQAHPERSVIERNKHALLLRINPAGK